MPQKYSLGLFAVGVALTACVGSVTDGMTTPGAGSSSTAAGSVSVVGANFNSGGSSDSTTTGSTSSGGSDATTGNSDVAGGGAGATTSNSDVAGGGSDATTGGADATTGGATSEGGAESGGSMNGGANDPACPAATPLPTGGERCTPLARPTDRCVYPTESCVCVVPPVRGPVPGAGGMGAGGARTIDGTLTCRPIGTGAGGRSGMASGGAAAGGAAAGGAGGNACRGRPPVNGGACTGTETCPLPNNHSCTCTADKWACR